jgi:hypothetical protein
MECLGMAAFESQWPKVVKFGFRAFDEAAYFGVHQVKSLAQNTSHGL